MKNPSKTSAMLVLRVAVLVMAVPARPVWADTILSTVPDLTTEPGANTCSQCDGDGQNSGERVTLDSPVTIGSLYLAVNSYWYFPSSITLTVFLDAAPYPDTNAPGTVGTMIYQSTFSPDSFAAVTYSDFPVDGVGTAVVGFNTPSLNLSAGTYDFFFTSTTELNLQMWYNVNGNAFISSTDTPGVGPSAGSGYYVLPYDLGLVLSTDAIPEPAGIWLLFPALGLLALIRTSKRSARAS